MWPRPRPRLRGPRRPRRARLRARSLDALAAAGVRDEVGKNSDLIVREGVVERGHRALAVRDRFTDDGGVRLRLVEIGPAVTICARGPQAMAVRTSRRRENGPARRGSGRLRARGATLASRRHPRGKGETGHDEQAGGGERGDQGEGGPVEPTLAPGVAVDLGEPELFGMDVIGRHSAFDELGREARDHRGRPADERVCGGEVAELLLQALGSEETVPVSGHDHDPEVRAPSCDGLKLVEEVRLVFVLDAVVKVDRRPTFGVEAAGHAQEGGDADSASQPNLPGPARAIVRERAVRTFDDGLGTRLELTQRARVVTDGLDGDPQGGLARRRGDRERMKLVADLAGTDREHLAAQRELEWMQRIGEGE